MLHLALQMTIHLVVISHTSKGKVYGFTIEFADDKIGFIPPISEMQNIIKEVSSAMTELCISASKNGKGT